MQFWIIQTLNSLALGGLLFLLAAGFSLIFGLMRIANLTHGSLFMLGAYLGVSVLRIVPNLWLAALIAALAVALCGGLLERLILRPLTGKPLGQVLVTLGISFIVADLCLMIWGGDPIPLAAPTSLQRPLVVGSIAFPAYRLVVLGISIVTAIALHALMEWTRIGAMIRAGVDDMQMARAVGIPVSRLFTTVFCLGAALAGAGGVIGGPIMSAYPGLDADMLPLAKGDNKADPAAARAWLVKRGDWDPGVRSYLDDGIDPSSAFRFVEGWTERVASGVLPSASAFQRSTKFSSTPLAQGPSSMIEASCQLLDWALSAVMSHPLQNAIWPSTTTVFW